MDKPLVSVHLLTYNHAQFIRQSIESVVAQETTFPFEIIIGDDHSTDGTSAIVDEYAVKYPDLIKVVRGKKNGGPQPNSIRILENCSGKYMAALEGDDYWIDPYKLQKQADFMEANPEFAICFTNTRVEFFGDNGDPYLLNQDIEKDVLYHDVDFSGATVVSQNQKRRYSDDYAGGQARENKVFTRCNRCLQKTCRRGQQYRP
jgi:glycosyltransferase involved in cell wall biosynthesis